MSTELVSIYKNLPNILWERMLYKCKILIHMGVFMCMMAEQTPLLFYDVLLHPQPTEIITTEIILFG